MDNSWDGTTERRQKAQDHDTLVQMVEILKNHVNNFDMHREDYKEHKQEDKINFKRIDKTIYTATGVLIAVVFIARIVFK